MQKVSNFRNFSQQLFIALLIFELFSNIFRYSYVLPLGLSLEDNTLMGIVYLAAMFFVFIGITIVSDIFMDSIEVITAQTRMRPYVDNFGKEL